MMSVKLEKKFFKYSPSSFVRLILQETSQIQKFSNFQDDVFLLFIFFFFVIEFNDVF